jgi:peptidyl-prolyl cis-trans isomerase D
MLSIFRRGVTAKIMLGVLGLALFALVVTGFGTGGDIGNLAGGGDRIASTGDEEVTSTEVVDQVNRQLAQARQQQPELDMATFLGAGVIEEVVRQLISSKALLSFAQNLGFSASKTLIDAEIASIPAFHNLAGQFDNTTYQQALQQQGITDQALRDEIRGSLIQRQVLTPLVASARVPQSLALQYASLLLERRTGSVGVVPAASMPAGPAPTAAEIQTFYQQNQSRYRIPERRVVRYVPFGLEQVAAAARPTEAEIASAYRANAGRYGAQESRTLSQVVLPTQQAAQQFAAKIARGTSFTQAAAEAGFSNRDINVGQQNRAQFASLTSPPVANAAFAAAQGAVTPPTQSDFGWHVVRVDAINRTAARPLAAVRPELEKEVSERKQQDALATLITRIEESLADGASLEEVARDNNLQIRETPPVTAAGGIENGQLAPEAAPLVKTAFEMTEDEEPVVESLVEGKSFAIVAPGRVIPAAPPPLAQIQDRVRADLIAKRQGDRARTVAAGIVAKINAGTAPAQAFAQAGVALPAPQPVNARRMDIAQGNQVPPPLAMMFSMKKGTAKVLPAPNGAGWFVVHLAQIEAGNAKDQPQLVQSTQQQFSQVVGDEYVAQFLRAVERQEGVKRNEDAVRKVRQQLLGPGSR